MKFAAVATSALSDAISENIQRAMNLGIRWAVKDPAGGSFQSGNRRLHLSAAFEGAFKCGRHLTRRNDPNQPSNAAFEGCVP